jgi:hypothetical protein
MPTASHRKQLTARVFHSEPSGTADNPGTSSAAARPHLNLSCHRPSHGSRFTVVSGALLVPTGGHRRTGGDVPTERGIDIGLR